MVLTINTGKRKSFKIYIRYKVIFLVTKLCYVSFLIESVLKFFLYFLLLGCLCFQSMQVAAHVHIGPFFRFWLHNTKSSVWSIKRWGKYRSLIYKIIYGITSAQMRWQPNKFWLKKLLTKFCLFCVNFSYSTFPFYRKTCQYRSQYTLTEIRDFDT